MDRLVLGCAPGTRQFVEQLAEQPASLLVLVGDEARAETLRDSGIDTRVVDPTDPAAIRTVAGDAASVVVASEASPEAAAIADAARSAYPDAFLLACFGRQPSEPVRSEVAAVADRVVDGLAETRDELLAAVGEGGLRTRKLQHVLRTIDGPLAIVAHDNPDPDAIGSAIGLKRIAEAAGVEATACYYGDINHQENRALVNLLEFDLQGLDADCDPSSFGGIALVDHSRPGTNDGLPPEADIDIVIDHHPPRQPIQARFVDLRSDVGATCTLVAGYLRELGIPIDENLASGLLYGIWTDTQAFSRGVSRADFQAATGLIEAADREALQRIESPSVTAGTLGTVQRAISNRTVRDDVLVTCVGQVSDRDALSQAADKLLNMQGVSTVLVCGYTDETVFISARARGADLDLGETLREAFGQIGSAGGHADMAGAQIPVGILLDDADERERRSVIEDVITERFFEAVGMTPDYVPFVYADTFGGVE